jgi:aminoglycoside phosphotransferase (APT) family kinase protein
MLTEIAGIRVTEVTNWLQSNIGAAQAPFRFEIIAGGLSNLTFKVTGADGRRFVLRRPPLRAALASAHDMSRKYRIVSALGASNVPVAPAFGLCTDASVNDAPFYVMDFVDGHVIKTAEDAVAVLSTDGRAAAGESLIDTLGRIHAVDIEAVGLSTLGKHDGYIARQLKRWQGQVHAESGGDHRRVDEIHAELARRIPVQNSVSIVHGDYRLDNCLLAGNGHVAAVLDWEICALGDPMADLGLLMVYWTGPDDESSVWEQTGTTAPGFLNRRQVADRYAALTGRDISQLDYFEAFAYWKLACIMDGVYSRSVAGGLGDQAIDSAPFLRTIDHALTRSRSLLERTGSFI